MIRGVLRQKISKVWFRMAKVLLIQGKVENIFDDEDFARTLRDRLGDDVELYFRERIDPENILGDLNPLEYCPGECEETEKIQERYESILHDVQERLEDLSVDLMDQTKRETQKQINQLVNKINSEL